MTRLEGFGTPGQTYTYTLYQLELEVKQIRPRATMLSALRRHFFRWWPNAILIAKPVLLLLHRKVDRPLDKGKHDLIDTRFLGWVVDLELAQ